MEERKWNIDKRARGSQEQRHFKLLTGASHTNMSLLKRWETGTTSAIGHLRQPGCQTLEALKVAACLQPGTGRFFWKKPSLREILLWTWQIQLQLEAEELQGKMFFLGPLGDAARGSMGWMRTCARRNRRISWWEGFSIYVVRKKSVAHFYVLSFAKSSAVEHWRTHTSNKGRAALCGSLPL